MLLGMMQDKLAALYETPIEHCVGDFLITDAALAQALEDNPAQRINAERLLLRDDGDHLDISLFIDRTILASLAACDPYTRLDNVNLNVFLIALEGVSHFNYIVWNARQQRQVTQLELELQAEVDKYVTAMMILDEQGSYADSDDFHDILFSRVVFDSTADDDSEQRYREANRYAGKYCKDLQRRYPGQHREPSFMNEIRRFYRLPQNQKIRRIEHH